MVRIRPDEMGALGGAILPRQNGKISNRSASPLGIDKEALSNIRGNVLFHRLAWYHTLIGEYIDIILLGREDIWLSRFSAGTLLSLTSPAW